jgi:phage recombination protein Bet
MSTALATQNHQIKAHTAEERYFTEEQMKLLSDHIMKGATPIELQYFGEVCKRVGLDPFKKQIHAVQRWDNTAGRMVWSYQTGIDGYVAIAHRGGLCAGIEDIKFLPEDESTPNPIKATCTVWKIVGGQRVPFTASARWTEYVQTKKDGKPNSMWMKMPYGQLGKCARALAIRMAFPEEIGGILTDVEMEQADSESDRGEQVKGRPTQGFDLESKPFEEPAKQVEPPKEEPGPLVKKPAAATIEAEIVPALAVPERVAAWIQGRWKQPWGELKGKAITEKRQAALDQTENHELAFQALASIYDEAQARIAAKGMSESDFADMVCANGIDGIDYPADLWSKMPKYPAILNIAKAIK